MSIAKVTEITAGSNEGFQEAINAGIARANTTLENIKGFWVQDLTGKVENGQITEYRVNMKVSFLLKE
jgi:flavin-binding protein dodecin